MPQQSQMQSQFSSFASGQPTSPQSQPLNTSHGFQGTPWKINNYTQAPTTNSLRLPSPVESHKPQSYTNHFYSTHTPSRPGNPHGITYPTHDETSIHPRAILHDQNTLHISSTPSDSTLTHGPTISEVVGHSPVVKAGSHHTKSHEKSVRPSDIKKRKREDTPCDSSGIDSDDSNSPARKQSTHGGRRTGAGNYQEQDIKALLKYTQKVLPMGQRGWKKVHEKYTSWANVNGRPVREWKNLENKFKTLVKTKKPTGSGKRPESVTHAKAIDKMINDKAGTRNLNDSEFEDDDAGRGGSSGPEDSKPDSKIHTAIATSDRSEAPQVRRPRASQTTELVSKIAQALDPDVQRVRDEERAERSFQNTQAFTLSASLRDAQARIETLRSELNDTRDRLHKVEHICDRLDMELNFERRMFAISGVKREAPHSPGSRKNHKYLPDLVRVRGKVRHDEYFPEGGQSTTWITDGSSASDWDDDHKENFKPSIEHYHPFSSSTTPSVKPQHYRKYAPATQPSQPLASTSFKSPTHAFPAPGQEEKPNDTTPMT